MYDQAKILEGDANWQLEDLNYFHKCGEITASPDVQCFGLNCRFCSGICLQFEVFMQHLREQHSKDVLAMYSMQKIETLNKIILADENVFAKIDEPDKKECKIVKSTEKDTLSSVQLDNLGSRAIEATYDESTYLQNNNGIWTLKNGNEHSSHTMIDESTSTTNLKDLPASTLNVMSSSSSSSNASTFICSVDGIPTDEQLFIEYNGITDESNENYESDTRHIISDKQFNSSHNIKKQNQIQVPVKNAKVIQNRDVLSFLLGAFKSESALWDPQHVHYKTCNRLKIYDEIAQQLKLEMRVSLSGQVCYLEIQKLCTRYSKELRLKHKRNGSYVPKIWCFQKMEFLREIYEQKLSKHIEKLSGIIAQKPQYTIFPKSKEIKFTSHEEKLKFIELYKNQQSLWNVDHPDFRSTTFRKRALNLLLDNFNAHFGGNHTLEELQKTIFKLRKDFSTRKHKQLQDAVEGHSYNVLEFLEPHVGPFRCTVCAKLVKTVDQYKIHKSQHDGTLPFLCPLCGKGFKMSGNLSIHLRRHKRDFPYACENPQCEKSFATSTEALIHRRTHTGERPYVCEICSKSFKTWSFFDIHRRTHLKQSTFHCPICDKGFYEKNRYTDHMNGHLHIRKHQCTECNKNFTTCANLKKHLELHLPIKKYKCTICNKRFAQFASLRWHKTKKHEVDEKLIESKNT